MKPTGREGTGHGRGLAALLSESWAEKHSLQPFLPEVGASKDNFERTQCCQKCFCHCGESKEGMQAFFFHRKLVSCLRPFLFQKQPKKTGKEKQLSNVKKKKTFTKASLHMMKNFLILRLEPQDPEAGSIFQSHTPTAAGLAGSSGGWLRVARAAAANHNEAQTQISCKQHLTPQPLWFHVSYVNYKTLEFTGLPLTGAVRNNGTDQVQARLQAISPIAFYRSFEFFKENISFPHAYTASMWVIQANDSQIPIGRMTCRDLVATPFTTIPPFKAWKGERQETIDRKDAEDREKEKQRKRNERKRKPPAKGLITRYSRPLKSQKTKKAKGPSTTDQTESPDFGDLGFGDDLPISDDPEFLQQEQQEQLDHEADSGDEGEGQGSSSHGSGEADHDHADDDDGGELPSSSSSSTSTSSDSESGSDSDLDFDPDAGHERGLVLEAGAASGADGGQGQMISADASDTPVAEEAGVSAAVSASAAETAEAPAPASASDSSAAHPASSAALPGPRPRPRNAALAAPGPSHDEVPPGCTLRLVSTSASPLWIGLLPTGKKFKGNKTKSKSFQHSSYQSSSSTAAQRSSDEARAEVLAWLWDWYNSDSA